MKLRLSIITTVCALSILPSVASAQSVSPSLQPVWLQDRRYTEGIGVRLGDFELHPGVGAQFGYDSNYLLRASGEDPIGSLHLQVAPSITISTLSPQRRDVAPGSPPPSVEFRAGISGIYHEFIPVSGSDAGQDLLRKQRNVTGGLDMSLGILPGRPWSGQLFGDVARYVLPSNQGQAGNFNHVSTRVGGDLAWTPGGGLFDWHIGYAFLGNFFEQQTQLTNYDHEFSTRGRWRFLPRTALMYDGRFGIIQYPSGANAKTGSHPVRARLGINGLVTPSFGILALAGWGASFYTPAGQNNFDSVIGQAELRWYITPNPGFQPGAATLSLSSLAVGFNRDFVDSYIGTYFASDRGYLNLSYFFSGRFLLVAEGGVAAISYPSIQLPATVQPHDGWTDVRIDATLFGEYRLKDAFGINATVRYDGNLSSTQLQPVGGASADDLSYNRLQAYLGVRWFM